jgi:hypothetical protein
MFANRFVIFDEQKSRAMSLSAHKMRPKSAEMAGAWFM